MQLLHFSDTHSNRRAIEAVARVAAKWKEACVAVTGDVCNGRWHNARPEFNELTNPRIWFVRGNHDEYPSDQFGHLSRVEWQTPYLADLQSCVLVGLDSERRDGVDLQLREIVMPEQRAQQRVLIVLHHRPFSTSIKQAIISWAKTCFPSIVSIVLLHGHEHHHWDFFAEVIKEDFEGVRIITSHVYSANMGFRNGAVAGCANLFDIGNSGNILVETVYDT